MTSTDRKPTDFQVAEAVVGSCLTGFCRSHPRECASLIWIAELLARERRLREALQSVVDHEGRACKDRGCTGTRDIAMTALADEPATDAQVIRDAFGRRPDLPPGKDYVDDVRHGEPAEGTDG